jgi:hypothetical protein
VRLRTSVITALEQKTMSEKKTDSTSAVDRIVIKRVDSWMRIKYGIGLDAMQITDTPGYWQDREPRLHPGHQLHGCIGCSGPFKATYTYFDTGREGGRFVSPTKSWRFIRDSLPR